MDPDSRPSLETVALFYLIVAAALGALTVGLLYWLFG